MRKLLFILMLLPAILFGQQQSGSFKIAKEVPKKGKDTLRSSNFSFFLHISGYKGFASVGDFFKTKPKFNTIQDRVDIAPALTRTVLRNNKSILLCYAQTGVTAMLLTSSNIAIFSMPLDLGLYYSISRIIINVDGGEQFFFKAYDSEFSKHHFFDWGGGVGIRLRKYDPSYRIVNLTYRRFDKINLFGFGIII